jgi:eukaryotic-like serine/threonine-protein kinase
MQETASNNATSTPAAPRTDRLELIKELSRGSIGIVHQARNSQSGRIIALRQFEVPQWLDDVNDLLKRILAEARGASTLNHPHIGHLHTCGYRGFTVFMTSEFVEGQTLKAIMSARPAEMSEVLAYARQLCEALDYAHEKGVFHHFLNPSNIKIQPDGTLTILDFGVLRDKHLLSQTPVKKLESEPYLSPEQVRNKPPDRAANLFSAATIIYELYTARSPFAGMHLGEVDRAITDNLPHPLNMAHPRVSPQVSAVVLKALSKDPAERFASGTQFYAALEEAAKSEPSRLAAPTQAASSKIGVSAPANTGADSAETTGQEQSGTTSLKVPRPPEARVQVGSFSQWKLLGALAACLFVVALLAFMFQRRPREVVEIPEAQPVASATPAPVPVVAPTPEPVIGEIQPEETPAPPEATPFSRKKGKNARASRKTSAPAVIAPSEGQMMVTSLPPDAAVEIEGHSGQWKTQQTINSLVPGTYKVTTTKPGYAPDVRSVQVNGGGRTVVDVRLTAVKGFLAVGGTPAGASVFINGKDTGKLTPTTLILDPAKDSVAVRKAGYLESTMQIQLVAGQTASYAPTLMVAGRTDNIKIVNNGRIGKLFGGGGGTESGRARIEIKTDPKGAQVIINGTPLQKSTPVEIQVEAGNYDITLEKEGYKAVHESAIVGVDDRVKIEKSLSR